MESEIVDIMRKVSMASQGVGDTRKSLEDAKLREASKGNEPPDTLYMVRILLMLTGLMQLLPGSFFITANDYWMYKFRNTTLDIVDSKHRTTLQAFFISWTSIVSSIPSVITAILSTFYGHKFRTRSRLLVTLFVVLSCFVVFTGFIKINTDTWQLLFFCLTMLVIVIIHVAMSLFHASSMALISKFPRRFTKFYLYGEGSSGIITSTLQIASLAIVPSSESAALIYFLVGTSMIGVTYVLIFCSKYFALVQYYASSDHEDTKRPIYKLTEVLGAMKQIWPSIFICCIVSLHMTFTHPNITTLVVSEDNGNGHPWADKYFVPCITFLFGSIASLVGRFLSTSFRIKKSTIWIWIVLVICRMAIFLPAILLCNALPRHHLPVVFGHDWEFILIIGANSFTGGAIFNILFLSIQEFASGNEELAYLSLMMFMSVYHTITSPLHLLSVKLL